MRLGVCGDRHLIRRPSRPRSRLARGHRLASRHARGQNAKVPRWRRERTPPFLAAGTSPHVTRLRPSFSTLSARRPAETLLPWSPVADPRSQSTAACRTSRRVGPQGVAQSNSLGIRSRSGRRTSGPSPLEAVGSADTRAQPSQAYVQPRAASRSAGSGVNASSEHRLFAEQLSRRVLDETSAQPGLFVLLALTRGLNVLVGQHHRANLQLALVQVPTQREKV